MHTRPMGFGDALKNIINAAKCDRTEAGLESAKDVVNALSGKTDAMRWLATTISVEFVEHGSNTYLQFL